MPYRPRLGLLLFLLLALPAFSQTWNFPTRQGNNVFTGTNTFQGKTVVRTPLSSTEATTKAYVDAKFSSQIAGVSTFATRQGDITPQASDYSAFYAAITHTHHKVDIVDFPVLPQAISCSSTDKIRAYDPTTGLFTCAADQAGVGGGSNWGGIGGVLSAQTDLQNALNAKADLTYTSTGLATKADLTTTNAALALKADTSAMTTALLGKANLAHTHVTGDISNFPTTWAWGALTGVPSTFAPSAHVHPEADVTGLTVDLANRVPTTRTINGYDLSANRTLVKGDIGLGNVDNTTDANKPVSTATQTALNAKAYDNAVVHNTGDESVAGVKTFSNGLNTSGANPSILLPNGGTTAANTFTAAAGVLKWGSKTAAMVEDLSALGTPGGVGSEIQYRAGATTLGAALGSSVDGSGNVTLGGALVLGAGLTLPTSIMMTPVAAPASPPPARVIVYADSGTGNLSCKKSDGSSCIAAPGGTGTVNAGTTGQLAYYAGDGTAVSGTAFLPNGITATTQALADNSTKVATNAYVDRAVAAVSAGACSPGTPASPDATGTAGSCQYDGNFFYVAIASNTWKRITWDGAWLPTVAVPAYVPDGASNAANDASVTISDATPGSAVKYCTDTAGSCDPTAGSTYSTPVTVSAAAVGGTYLRSVGTRSGYNNSSVKSALYTYQGATPTASPAAGVVATPTTVTFSSTTTGVTFHYTTDGVTSPTCSTGSTGSTYNVTVPVTLKAVACKSNYSDSAVLTAAYTIQTVATPTASPAAGAVSNPTTVTFSSATTGSTFHYTTDGVTDPTCSTGSTGSTYNVTTAVTLKVVGCKATYADSGVLTSAYTISGGGAGIAQVGTATSVSDHADNTLALTKTLTGGNEAIVGFIWSSRSNTVSSVSGSVNGAYTLINCFSESFGADAEMCLYHKPNVTGGSETVTITLSGTPTTMFWGVLSEWSGVATTTPVDQTNAGAQIQAANPSISTSGSTVQTNELVIGFLGGYVTTPTPGSGWTSVASYDGGTNINHGSMIYMIAPSTGVQTPTWTAVSDYYWMQAATFKHQ